jgi:hypothetical protein
MKTERRHELQTNQLADWLGESLLFVERYTKAIIATVVALAVVVLATFYLNYQSSRRQAAVWERYFNATNMNTPDELGHLAERFPNTVAAQWAHVTIGDTELAQGIGQLFEDRNAAKASLQRAMNSYFAARAQSSDPELLARATMGVAEAYEAESKLPEARHEYEVLVKRWPDNVLAKVAGKRLEDLNKTSTKEFYDWFASQNNKTSAPKDDGIPGLKPKFDAGSLPPEEPGLKFEHGSADKSPATNAMPGLGKPAADKQPPAAETPAATTPPAAAAPPAAATTPAGTAPATPPATPAIPPAASAVPASPTPPVAAPAKP